MPAKQRPIIVLPCPECGTAVKCPVMASPRLDVDPDGTTYLVPDVYARRQKHQCPPRAAQEPEPERVPEKLLTRTQRQALAGLRQRRHLWPAGRGRWSGGNETPWERPTLDALVNAGYARWADVTPGAGVLPHIELR